MKVIDVVNVGKRFMLKHEAQRTLKSFFLGILKGQKIREEFWALKGINFQVEEGETLGIIGANGAGKSTLLGLIARTMRPTEGTVSMTGVLSSLLELGAGFHPDLTGRENIFLYGSIMGLSKRWIQERYQCIVDFSELKDFIDVPVKYYSSGMYVRLGFSVAVEVNPDILLIDEVLAVGDETFRKKCLSKFKTFKEQGKTMLIVSHELETVKKISDRVLLLDQGKLIEYGDPADVVDEYLRLGLDKQGEQLMTNEWGTRQVEIIGVSLQDKDGQEKIKFTNGENLIIEIKYNSPGPVDNPVFGFSIADQDGKVIFGTNTQITGMMVSRIDGEGIIRIELEKLPILRGKYYLSFAVHNLEHQVNYHRLDNWKSIWVESRRDEIGFVDIPVAWEVKR